MTNADRIAFLVKAREAASTAGHPWPGAAAAEAAVETGWGQSLACRRDNNLLGIKAPSWWTGPTSVIPTEEDNGGAHTEVATWSVFTSWVDCFRCQMAILHRSGYYAAALAATTAAGYITAESARWSTSPARGAEVLATHNAHRDVLEIA